MAEAGELFEGGCVCRLVRYRMHGRPMVIHCCHCRWCQRETGAAFAFNGLIEADRVELSAGEPVPVDTPSNSGKGQKIWRCPKCMVALWSNYAGAGQRVRFVRMGTLDDSHAFKPDIHIYTSSKQPWVVLPEGALSFPEFYDLNQVWPQAALERRAALRAARS